MNPLITLLDQALQANLSKRQWAAFAAVLRQTVGFNKHEDDLSARRLEQLTGIQRNHIWQAKKELEQLGLLHSRPGQYGDILSCSVAPPVPAAPAENRASSSPPIPPPLVPKTGQSAPETGETPAQIGIKPRPKQDTTRNHLTDKDHHNVAEVRVADATVLRYPPDLSSSERQQAPACLDGLSPAAAQQVLAVWDCKIRQGEVRKSRIGLLVALVKAQRQGNLDTRCLSREATTHTPPNPSTPTRTDALSPQQRQAREHWLEQQAQQAWLRDMQHFGVLTEHIKPPQAGLPGGAP